MNSPCSNRERRNGFCLSTFGLAQIPSNSRAARFEGSTFTSADTIITRIWCAWFSNKSLGPRPNRLPSRRPCSIRAKSEPNNSYDDRDFNPCVLLSQSKGRDYGARNPGSIGNSGGLFSRRDRTAHLPCRKRYLDAEAPGIYSNQPILNRGF